MSKSATIPRPGGGLQPWTVRDLRLFLQEAHADDAIVVLARDAEENGYRPLMRVDTDAFFSERDEEIADEKQEDGQACVLLVPMD